MSLKLTIQKEPEFAQQWVTHESGAEFLINGIGNKAYNVALERIQDATRRIDLKDIKEGDESPSDLTLEAAGRYLIADWRNIKIGENGEEKETAFTKEMGALALKNMISLWLFIHENAVRIQLEADKEKEELLGKLETESTGKAQTQRKSKTQSTKP